MLSPLLFYHNGFKAPVSNTDSVSKKLSGYLIDQVIYRGHTAINISAQLSPIPEFYVFRDESNLMQKRRDLPLNLHYRRVKKPLTREPIAMFQIFHLQRGKTISMNCTWFVLHIQQRQNLCEKSICV